MALVILTNSHKMNDLLYVGSWVCDCTICNWARARAKEINENRTEIAGIAKRRIYGEPSAPCRGEDYPVPEYLTEETRGEK